MSQIQKLHSVKVIEQKFLTGEEPVLVRCSDRNAYICKYAQSTQAAYKMVCELIGASMAQAWHLNTPDVAFVKFDYPMSQLTSTNTYSKPCLQCNLLLTIYQKNGM